MFTFTEKYFLSLSPKGSLFKTFPPLAMGVDYVLIYFGVKYWTYIVRWRKNIIYYIVKEHWKNVCNGNDLENCIAVFMLQDVLLLFLFIVVFQSSEVSVEKSMR